MGLETYRIRSVAAVCVLWVWGAAGQTAPTRAFRIVNSCPVDVWLGIQADQTKNPGVVPQLWDDSGHLSPGDVRTVVIPSSTWISGRVWARTGCSGAWQKGSDNGQPRCNTGDCGGRAACQTPAYSLGGQTGVTLAEFTLQDGNNKDKDFQDYYDVSSVDGFSLPVRVSPIPSFDNSVKVDPGLEYEKCGVAGSCFDGLTLQQWDSTYLKSCPVNNQVFGNPLLGDPNKCPTGTRIVGSTLMCIDNGSKSATPAAFQSLCVSDASLSSQTTASRDANPPAGWPAFADHAKYACPGPPDKQTDCSAQPEGTCYLTNTCPANYHLLQSANSANPGVQPYIAWPQWFASACTRGAYGFTYDDKPNSYACKTTAGSGAYSIEFCPGGTHVVDAADSSAGPVAPGELLTMFVHQIGPAVAAQAGLTSASVPLSLGGVRVYFDRQPAPLLYTGLDQINLLAPFALQRKSSTKVEIEVNGSVSDTFIRDVAPAHPRLFTYFSQGTRQALVFNSDWTPNLPLLPAKKGSVVQFFLSGAGQTNPPAADGQPSPLSDTPLLANSVAVRIGGVPAVVRYAGAIPMVAYGLAQINVEIPVDAPSGPAVSFELAIAGQVAQTGLTIAVQ